MQLAMDLGRQGGKKRLFRSWGEWESLSNVHTSGLNIDFALLRAAGIWFLLHIISHNQQNMPFPSWLLLKIE